MSDSLGLSFTRHLCLPTKPQPKDRTGRRGNMSKESIKPTVEQLRKRFKTKDNLLIVGFATSSAGAAPVDKDDQYDIWGLNGIDRLIPGKYNLNWDLHKDELPQERIEFAQKTGIPVLMPAIHPDLPNSLEFPFDELIAAFGSPYFACTFAWQMALAIAFGYKVIDIYGVDMTQDSEYAYERPCAEYYIGIARGAGIQVGLPDTTALCSLPFIYGKTEINARPWRRIDMVVQQRLQVCEQEKRNLDFQRGRVEGAADMLAYIRTMIHENLRTFNILDRHGEAPGLRVGGASELRLYEPKKDDGEAEVMSKEDMEAAIASAIREPGT